MNRWIRLLEWICPSSLYEGIEGDILEQYENDKEIIGLRKAKRRLALNVIGFMRPGILLRNHFLSELNKWMMLQNNLRIAFRYLMKSKTFTIINITGLAVGIAAFLLIVHYVRYEYSYEDFHTNSKNIYRITLDNYKGSEFVVSDCEMYAPVGPLLADRYPEVEDYVRFYEFSNQEVKSGDQRFFEDRIGLADPSILSVFSFHLVNGNAATALKAPFEAVITESMAKKYFPNAEAIGQVLEIRNKPFKITGVIADPPLSTHLKVNLLLSHSSLPQLWDYKDTEFQGNNEYTYLLMNEQADLTVFNDKLKALSVELKDKIGDDRLVAEPMKDIHLYSTKSYEPEPPGNYRVVNFLLLISVFILLIAWINYINLSTARAVERAREVGIRKVMGSLRIQLIFQFLSESTIVVLLASLLALLLVYISLPLFINLAGLPSLPVFRMKETWYLTGGVVIGGSLLAGLYPAFVLSSFQPVSVLKGRFQSSVHGQWLRKGLVVFQFASAVVLIICLTTVYLQINYLQKQDLGMNIDQTLGVRSPVISDSIYLSRSNSFINALRSQSSIKAVARSGGALPGMSMQELSSTGNVYRLGQQDADRGYIYYVNSFDEDFIRLFNMKLLAGRNFKKDDPDIIINEEAMRLLGFKSAEEAVGSKVFFYDKEKIIAGVLKNFHQRSPKEKHIPMIFWYSEYADYFAIHVSTNEIQETMKTIMTAWEKSFPASAFDYVFLNDRYNSQYKSDQQFGKVVGLFSFLAALIACLGLFGLSSFTIVQRMKEIGIRKVLGASVRQIVQLLSLDFVKLIMVAGLAAIPFAYFAMEGWLSSYATRIQMNVWLFVIPSLVVLLIALITVSFQTIQAAQSNPVNTLKSE